MFILIQRYINRVPAPNLSLMGQLLKLNEYNMILENRILVLEVIMYCFRMIRSYRILYIKSKIVYIR